MHFSAIQEEMWYTLKQAHSAYNFYVMLSMDKGKLSDEEIWKMVSKQALSQSRNSNWMCGVHNFGMTHAYLLMQTRISQS